MHLRAIRYGMMAGFSFLASIALLDWLAYGSRTASTVAPKSSERDITNEVWQVLAEARRITEESA